MRRSTVLLVPAQSGYLPAGVPPQGVSARAPRLAMRIGLLTALVATTGCSSRPAPQAADEIVLPDACNSYVARFRDCLTKSDPRASDLAEARANSVRASLAAAAQGTRDEAARTALGNSCAGSLARIATACPP